MWVVGATLTSARFRIVVGHKRGGGKTPETVAQKRREHFIKGKASKEIARRLGLSPITVRRHISSLAKKIGATGRAELVETLKRSAS